jgi:hypothetical protein
MQLARSPKKSSRTEKRKIPQNQKQQQNKIYRPRAIPVQAPVARSKVISGVSKPNITSSSNGFRIRHREYLGPQTGSALSFAVTRSEFINPSNAALFPWLSAIASRFESYKFHKLRTHYVPTCPTTKQGFMGVAIDFNVYDSPPTSKQQMLQYQSVVTGPCWAEFDQEYKRDDLQKRKTYFCDNAAVSTGARAMFHTGQLFIASGGVDGTLTNLGDLYLDYDIEFMTPEYNTAPPELYVANGEDPVSPRVMSTVEITTPADSNYLDTFTRSGDIITALKPFQALIYHNGIGTGFTPGGDPFAGGPLVNTSGLSSLGDYASSITATTAMASAVLTLAKGDGFDFSKIAYPSGWTTLTHSDMRFAPWNNEL